MKSNLKSLTAFVLLSVLATGCVSLSTEGDGTGARPDYVVSQMEDASRGK